MPKKKYKDLATDVERYQWHADVYAYRRVYLDVPDWEHTSPCDPKGEWYDEDIVHAATLQKRRERYGKEVQFHQRDGITPAEWDDMNAYARTRGYADWAALRDAIFDGTAPKGTAAGFPAWCAENSTAHPQRPGRVKGFQTLGASALGVTATEIPSDDFL